MGDSGSHNFSVITDYQLFAYTKSTLYNTYNITHLSYIYMFIIYIFSTCLYTMFTDQTDQKHTSLSLAQSLNVCDEHTHNVLFHYIVSGRCNSNLHDPITMSYLGYSYQREWRNILKNSIRYYIKLEILGTLRYNYVHCCYR